MADPPPEVMARIGELGHLGGQVAAIANSVRAPWELDNAVHNVIAGYFAESADLVRALQTASVGLGRWNEGLAGTLGFNANFVNDSANQFQKLDSMNGQGMEAIRHYLQTDVAPQVTRLPRPAPPQRPDFHQTPVAPSWPHDPTRDAPHSHGDANTMGP